uniref:Uncharacterized protein n=1 Tax=Quercus lobata TaxID=97700 RepID=A0A7N2R632_QUELO
MQYKFYVDGKWGYDESEHHVTSDYGIVNTLHLSTDDMDVDNDVFSACVVLPARSHAFWISDILVFSVYWSKYRMPWVIDDVEGRYISLQQSISLVAYLHEEFVII